MNGYTNEKLLGLSDVEKLTTFSIKQIYYRMKASGFPKPVNYTGKLEPHLSKWSEENVRHWINNQEQLPDGFIYSKDVLDKTGLSMSTLCHMIKNHRFPQKKGQVKNKNIWSKLEVEKWISERESKKIDTFTLAEVMELTGFNLNKIYRRMYKEQFPQNMKTGALTVGWSKDDINEWLENPEVHRGEKSKEVINPLPSNALNFDDVVDKTKLSKSIITSRIRAKKFPQKIRFENGSVGWLSADIDAYINKYNSLVNNSYTIAQVLNKTGLTESTIYLKMRKNLFPKQQKTLSGGTVWMKQDVDEWLNSQFAESKEFIDIKTVLKITGFSSSTLYRMMKLKGFPKKKERVLQKNVWSAVEVKEWLKLNRAKVKKI